MRTKNKSIALRVSEICFRKLATICAVTGKTKTAVIEDLIFKEYGKNKKYEQWFYADLNKNE